MQNDEYTLSTVQRLLGERISTLAVQEVTKSLGRALSDISDAEVRQYLPIGVRKDIESLCMRLGEMIRDLNGALTQHAIKSKPGIDVPEWALGPVTEAMNNIIKEVVVKNADLDAR